MNKKGSQVGMVLSFTIFIISLIMVYSMLGAPLKREINKDVSLKFLKENVFEEISEKVIIVRASLENASTCGQISNPGNDFENLTVIATSINGDEVASTISLGNTYFGAQEKIKLYYSENIFNKSLEQGSISCETAQIKSITEKNMVVENEIIKLLDKVKNDYVDTLNLLQISANEEYNVLFDYLNDTVIGEKKREAKVNIYAKEYLIKYLNKKGEEKIGKIIIKIW